MILRSCERTFNINVLSASQAKDADFGQVAAESKIEALPGTIALMASDCAGIKARMKHRTFPFALVVLALATPVGAADLRLGMIGLDTSHSVEYTRRLNDPNDKNFIPGARVIVAIRSGSPDMPKDSMERVPGFAKEMQERYGVKLVDSMDELLPMVDGVMVENVDGRPHLKEAAAAIKAGKPVFVDKPVAGTLHDAIDMYRLAQEARVPIFSGSSLRYYPNLQQMIHTDIGEIKGASTTGPSPLEPHHPDLFWYGIHATEALYTIMGAGCKTVSCTATPDTHLVTGVWSGGKVGTMRGIRNAKNGGQPYRATIFGAKNVLDEELKGDYTPFLREVVKFFQTGVAPVPANETLEIYAFMEAADESRRQGGCPIGISDVMRKARE